LEAVDKDRLPTAYIFCQTEKDFWYIVLWWITDDPDANVVLYSL